MNQTMKETLLIRKFSSLDYFEELSLYHKKAIQGLEDSIEWFYKHPPKEDWKKWHISDRPDGWEERALPNFIRNQSSIDKGIDYAKQGDLSYIEGAAGNLMSLSKDMDTLGRKWWEYVDNQVGKRYGLNMTKARKISSNIWRTVGDYFDPGEILDEEITGPIDEQELLKYLKPGETV